MPFDDLVLDEPAQLDQRDPTRLLWSLATAGAQVRRAADTATDAGIATLADAGPPRSLLVAIDPGHGPAAELVTRLAAPGAPAVVWDAPDLPRWAGPADALLVASLDGRDARLAELAAQGARRGLAQLVVAPDTSPVAAATAGRVPLADVPRQLHPRAARWTLLGPLVLALGALGLSVVPNGLLPEVADALDQQAETCRPGGDAFTNPAKALATEFATALPVIAGAGPLASVAATAIADAVQQLAGVGAAAVALPGGTPQAAALLRGGSVPVESGPDDLDDFFRDRVDEPVVVRPRLLVVGDDGDADDPLLGDRTEAQRHLDELAARRSATALHRLAEAVGVRSSSVDVPTGDPLARFAAATAFGDFTAAYLALGAGTDPGRIDDLDLW